jgi:ribosomal protein S18 acetylase RimI-like enzyme
LRLRYTDKMIRYDPLPPDRWREFRELRLEMLTLSPEAYGSRLQDAKKFSEEQWRERLTADPGFLGAYSEGRLVGTVACEDGEIYSLYVSPDFRGQGIGEHLLRWAIDQGGRLLTVVETQLPAKALYDRYGFKVVRTDPILCGDAVLRQEYVMLLDSDHE